MISSWSGCAVAAAALALSALTPAAAQEKGVLWETTSQAVIEGSPMKMPAVSGQHCAKVDWAEAPTSGDPSQHCQNTDFDRSGNKLTWSVACDNPPMTGQGELTFDGTDSYTGLLQFQSGQMNMHVNLSGKKIGTCDNPQ